jgi:hypothetical protein
MKSIDAFYAVEVSHAAGQIGIRIVYPIVAKVGGLQSQGGKREAVALYCERLPTLDLEPSGFPVG